MKDISLTHLLDVAICATEAAGKHARSNKDRRKETAETFDHDVKLVLDAECQAIAEKVIASEFPTHGILGEESVSPKAPGTYEWIIDPIDGTVNFSHGFEYWCSSVAVRRHGKVLAGCVFAPDLNAYYTAHIEEPAKLNGTPVQTSPTAHLQQALITTGLSKEMENAKLPHFEMFRMLAHNTKKVRIMGAAALDICRVADGTCDGFYETGIYLWDYAAAGLIAEQAGARLSVYPFADDPLCASVISANEKLIEGLRAIYTKCI